MRHALVIKGGKRHITNGMQLPNQDKIKRKPINTWGYWNLIPSYKRKSKKELRKNISEEPESYSRQNYIEETLSKEKIAGFPPSKDIRDHS